MSWQYLLIPPSMKTLWLGCVEKKAVVRFEPSFPKDHQNGTANVMLSMFVKFPIDSIVIFPLTAWEKNTTLFNFSKNI